MSHFGRFVDPHTEAKTCWEKCGQMLQIAYSYLTWRSMQTSKNIRLKNRRNSRKRKMEKLNGETFFFTVFYMVSKFQLRSCLGT